MHKLLPASLALALVSPFGAMADTTSELQMLRSEIEAMRAAYEARLQALEQRLKAAEAANAAASVTPAPAATTATSPAPARSNDAVAASSGGGTNAFNPSISLILSGTYTNTTQDPANYTIAGFQLPANAEVGPSTRGSACERDHLAASIDRVSRPGQRCISTR